MAESWFTRRLRERLQARIIELTQYLANGSATDYVKYKEHVGRIDGMREAMSFCDEIEREIE